MSSSHRYARAVVCWSLLFVICCARLALADSVTAARHPGEQRLPAYLIEVPESVASILIADAENASLSRFARTARGTEHREQRYMSVGQNGVGKVRAWDRKTPLGVYFITEAVDVSRLAAKYGVAAYALDYPNAWDRYNRRTGSGIWLHGVDPAAPHRPPRDTDGCLALPNGELRELADELVPQVTPVIIARRLEWVSAAEIEALRLGLRAVLERWRSSLERGDVHAYLSLYDDAFSARGMDKRRWATFRVGAFEARNLDAVSIDDLLLLRDPEDPALYVARFRQTLATEHGPVTTRKRLYWRRTGPDWRIISEDAG